MVNVRAVKNAVQLYENVEQSNIAIRAYVMSLVQGGGARGLGAKPPG